MERRRGTGAVDARTDVPVPALPSLATPSFFMLGDDEPAKPPKRARAKSKNAAPSKSTGAHRRKTAATRSAAGKSAENSESAQLVGTAASP